MTRTTAVKLADAADLFAKVPDRPVKVDKVPDRNRRRRLQRAAQRGMVAPILMRDSVRGEYVADGSTVPAHRRRYYGVTNLNGTMRARPHRNAQGIKGGQRGNGALHDGKVHGLTPTGKV